LSATALTSQQECRTEKVGLLQQLSDDTRPARQWLMRAILKTAMLAFGVLSLSGVTYWLIGLWNRRRGTWASIFYCYAGSHDFIASYALPGTIGLFRWIPSPIAVLRQGGRLGLVLASPVTEAEFLDPANRADFQRLQRRLARIARLMHVDMINVAGILPGVLARHGELPVNDSRPHVVDAVTAAVERMLADHLPSDTRDVIVIGGAGYLGRHVTAALRERGHRCHVVDPKAMTDALPESLRGRPCLLVDVARRGAIAQYIPQMWPGIVVLNEAFPCPSRRLVRQMAARGVKVFHLSGVAGSIIPPLPHGYENAVPCCAVHRPSKQPQVRIITLT
jgi:hypothetical protein